jgi:hypothetical protein
MKDWAWATKAEKLSASPHFSSIYCSALIIILSLNSLKLRFMRRNSVKGGEHDEGFKT